MQRILGLISHKRALKISEERSRIKLRFKDKLDLLCS